MASVPTFETIKVNTPPASPTILFDSNSFDAHRTEQVTSPAKRKRVRSGFVQAKRRTSGTAQSPRQVVAEGTQPPNDNEVVPQASRVPVDGYAAYVELVSDEVAGFFPLSEDLYIVQGWDDKSNQVKVSLGLVYRKSRLTNM